MSQEENILSARSPQDKVEKTALKHILSSKEWQDSLHNISEATGFDLSIYDEDGILFLTINENPICKLIKSSSGNGKECPASCNEFIAESLKLSEPATYKCYSRVMNFSIPIKYIEEKAVIIGRNGFTSYDNFLEFLKLAKDKGLHEIPVTPSLDFVDENYIKNISQYIHKAINYQLINLQEKNRLTEKLGRFTSLVDINILEKLSETPDSLYRYIVDTIEFIISPASVAMLNLDNQTSIYKTTCAAGKYKDILMTLHLDSENPFISQILTAKVPLSPVEIEAEKLITIGVPGELKYAYLFPIFVSGTMMGLIGVFNGRLSQEDVKIINAVLDYIEVTLKNHILTLTLDKKMDEILTSIFDSSRSIAPLLNWERLLQTIIEKATQLLRAEQGSLMLLEEETAELLVKAKKSIDDVIKENMRTRMGEGIAGRVFESGEPLLVEDVEKDPRINQKNRPRYKTKSFVSIPIKIEDRVTGVLNISDKINGEVFNENDLILIQAFATYASIAIERNLFYKEVEELKKLSVTDPLTGVLNRRYLNNRLSEEIARFNRYKHPFSFMMIDIDGFKEYNDTYGHITGDRVLKNIATTIVNSLRTIDIAVRFGGDEFVLILPQTPKIEAINIANRIKENIENLYISQRQELPSKYLTVSIGLSSYPEHASSASELLERTDQALYLAKKGGGNRLVYL
jgi:diguanylate cyclase (GGDEF)-like protein